MYSEVNIIFWLTFNIRHASEIERYNLILLKLDKIDPLYDAMLNLTKPHKVKDFSITANSLKHKI